MIRKELIHVRNTVNRLLDHLEKQYDVTSSNTETNGKVLVSTQHSYIHYKLMQS